MPPLRGTCGPTYGRKTHARADGQRENNASGPVCWVDVGIYCVSVHNRGKNDDDDDDSALSNSVTR